MNNLIKQMIGASRLNVETYEQVEADPGSTAGAVFVVVVASIAAAIGAGARDVISLIGATVVLLLTWMVWVTLTYIIGTRLLPEPQTRADIGEVLRTTGFSAAPGIFRILGFIPVIGLPIVLGITFWMLCTFVVAIRQALDYRGSGRALAVCILGWLIHGVMLFAFARVAI
jgi:hypothetical protein